jgi:hypothetical protein
LKKRTKKLFAALRDASAAGIGATAPAQAPTDKSFLLLFFKKEALPSRSYFVVPSHPFSEISNVVPSGSLNFFSKFM